MNNIHMRKFLIFIFILVLATDSGNSQIFRKNVLKSAEKDLFGKSNGNSKDAKIKEPLKVSKSKKQQEAKERKRKKDYAKSIKKSRKRTIEIQSPDVQTRMKYNQKDLISRDKIKKKKVKSGSRKAGKKYS